MKDKIIASGFSHIGIDLYSSSEKFDIYKNGNIYVNVARNTFCISIGERTDNCFWFPSSSFDVIFNEVIK